ncbi:MAG: DUF4062 domain-containing protein [Mesorhizobium sp.]|uniref:DUF4062 domain-containing protein n=1 Tax=Mesorhizobium sp. TaxID=1871066 RepID=UPI0009F6DBCC|nr:MAG: DUF4062 domain-containing protein [Mesorhizobium sp.]TGT94740.1 DUF4062 domain-containing protein [Mesorhizobium sp. M5C.F.Ca.ET.164.01.1.1]RWB25362.1 MAG: DUF4062 domain-containing protein [Mesorhizobium sp.]RWB80233.1 MAG: DUF4062 domain-containing protein [Mesorhizobium sp.]RWC22421.1 MAG: DUF4062 domain-containing protein [Mesorhizobium sp.]
MDVKYQIFVSSTYADLVDERRSVIEAVLNLGHIPVAAEVRSAARDISTSGLLILPGVCRKMRFCPPSLGQL